MSSAPVKGALEAVLVRSRLDADQQSRWSARAQAHAGQGFREFALATGIRVLMICGDHLAAAAPVAAFKHNDEVVAVACGGVNDAPALKRAG